MLYRTRDISGVSGTGVVAYGVQFPNGKVAIAWTCKPAQSVAVWDSLEDAAKVHGHGGATIVTFVDPDPVEAH